MNVGSVLWVLAGLWGWLYVGWCARGWWQRREDRKKPPPNDITMDICRQMLEVEKLHTFAGDEVRATVSRQYGANGKSWTVIVQRAPAQ